MSNPVESPAESALPKTVHVRIMQNGGEDGVPRRTTYEVFFPAGKGRKHAEKVRAEIEALVSGAVVPVPREAENMHIEAGGCGRKADNPGNQ